MKSSQSGLLILVVAVALGAYFYSYKSTTSSSFESIEIPKTDSESVTEEHEVEGRPQIVTSERLPASKSESDISITSKRETASVKNKLSPEELEAAREKQFQKIAEDNVRRGIIRPEESSALVQYLRTVTESNRLQEQEGYL